MPGLLAGWGKSGSVKTWGHRTVAPDQTLSQLAPIARKVGITRVADLTRLDRLGIPVFQAVRPLSRLLTVSQGKGLTPAAAEASAVMESIEIWHAETFDRVDVMARAQDLDSSRYVDPTRYPGPDYAGETAHDAIAWVEATELGTGTIVYVPRDVINVDYTREGDPAWILRTTNGLAGGNTKEEAVASGLAEVIERGCRRAHRLRGDGPERRINLDALKQQSGTLDDLIGRVQRADVFLDVVDMTNEMGVTTVGARIYEGHALRPVGKPASGFGAHLDPETAVVRAITEAAQTRLTHISGNRDDIRTQYYEDSNLANLTLRLLQPEDEASASLDLWDHSGESPADDISLMHRAVMAAGLGPVFVVDLTRSDIGVPVVKVLAPALQSIGGA